MVDRTSSDFFPLAAQVGLVDVRVPPAPIAASYACVERARLVGADALTFIRVLVTLSACSGHRDGGVCWGKGDEKEAHTISGAGFMAFIAVLYPVPSIYLKWIARGHILDNVNVGWEFAESERNLLQANLHDRVVSTLLMKSCSTNPRFFPHS